MSRNRKRNRDHEAQEDGGKENGGSGKKMLGIVLGVIVLAVLAFIYYGAGDSATTDPTSETDTTVVSAGQQAEGEASDEDATEEGEGEATSDETETPRRPRIRLNKLEGRWARQDGGYILEVRDVETDGDVEAAYFNPDPIHVSRAEAKYDEDKVLLFVELQDVNYPGCHYILQYDSDKDLLFGIYTQTAVQQQYQVAFVRMK